MPKQGTNSANWERLRMDDDGWDWFKAKCKKDKLLWNIA